MRNRIKVAVLPEVAPVRVLGLGTKIPGVVVRLRPIVKLRKNILARVAKPLEKIRALGKIPGLKNSSRGATVEHVLLVSLLVGMAIYGITTTGQSIMRQMEQLAGVVDEGYGGSSIDRYNRFTQLLQKLNEKTFTDLGKNGRLSAYYKLWESEVCTPFEEGKLSLDEFKNYAWLMVEGIGNHLPEPGGWYSFWKTIGFNKYNSDDSTDEKYEYFTNAQEDINDLDDSRGLSYVEIETLDIMIDIILYCLSLSEGESAQTR
ncbi:MAG: hypothetical protein LBB25_04525, partial [Holosporaceae bacterium]|jgi:hypothetical protein|nr:hypothetical protein [Holosporaceae bacterium]